MVFNILRRKQPQPNLVADQSLLIGSACTIFGESPSSIFAVVFEDDGETGYLYGLDRSRKEQPVLDVLHIYNVDQVIDKDEPSRLQIVWSIDGLKAVLLINGYAHAVFDFESKRGYCRNNFPPPSPDFSEFDHAWSDNALQLIWSEEIAKNFL